MGLWQVGADGSYSTLGILLYRTGGPVLFRRTETY